MPTGTVEAILIVQADAIKALQKMQREHIKSIEVKKSICDDWSDYIDAYFKTTVYSEKVRLSSSVMRRVANPKRSAGLGTKGEKRKAVYLDCGQEAACTLYER